MSSNAPNEGIASDFLGSFANAVSTDSSASNVNQIAAPRRSQNLPEEAIRLYGEAAVTYARGSRDEARTLCLEVVKMAPSYAPAYQLLASICEDESNFDGYLQYQLVAAHLTPEDYDLWIHLADIALGKAKSETNDSDLREKHFQLAAFCIRRATRVVPPTFPKLSLYERYLLTLENKPVKQYQVLQQILGDCPPQMFHAEYMDAFRSYAVHSLSMGDSVSAVNALLSASFYCPEHLKSSDISIFLDAAFDSKMWNHVLIFFNRLNMVNFISSENQRPVNLRSAGSVENGDLKTVKSWLDNFALGVEIDYQKVSDFLLSRLLSALLHSSCPLSVIEPLVLNFSKKILNHIDNPARFNDYLIVARSAATVNSLYFSLIVQLLSPLLLTGKATLDPSNPDLQTAIEINLWYANAKTAGSELNDAAHYYKLILEAAPQHIHVRQALADVFSKLDNRSAAISVLVEKFPLDSLSLDEFALRLAQCSVLSQCPGCEDAFVDASTHLMFGDKCGEVDDQTIIVFATIHTARLFCSPSGSQTDELDSFCPPLHTATILMPIRRLNIPTTWFPQIWDVFERLSKVLFLRKQFMGLFRLLTFCFFAPPMHDNAIEKVRSMLLVVSFAMKEWKIITTCVRSIIRTGTLRGQMQFPNGIWNMLAISSSHLDDMRTVTRSISRVLGKKRSVECDAIHLLLGHASFVGGNYRVALREYGDLIKRRPTDPLCYFMAGMCFIQLSANKFRNGRPLLFYQALCCFERYRRYRGDCQEVYFNIGRAMHHIGFTFVAADYYRKCLEMEPICGSKFGNYDLRPEAAYNLVQICRRSKSYDAARYYMFKYCTV